MYILIKRPEKCILFCYLKKFRCVGLIISSLLAGYTRKPGNGANLRWRKRKANEARGRISIDTQRQVQANSLRIRQLGTRTPAAPHSHGMLTPDPRARLHQAASERAGAVPRCV